MVKKTVKVKKSTVKAHKRKNPDGSISTVKPHVRGAHERKVEGKTMSDIEKDIEKDIKSTSDLDRSEKIVQAIHAKLRDLGTEGWIETFYDNDTGEWNSFSVYNGEIIHSKWDEVSITSEEKGELVVLNCVSEGVITPKMIKKLKEYSQKAEGDIDKWVIEEMKKLPEQTLPPKQEKKGREWHFSYKTKDGKVHKVPANKQRFIADDLSQIQRDINSKLIANETLSVKQKIALHKATKILQDIKTGKI